MIATTPQPPYYAVIFTSIRSNVDEEYSQTAELMLRLAEQSPGYLGFETARSSVGISVSYWTDLDAIKTWRNQMDHHAAQVRGKSIWYQSYKVRICKVERDYEFSR